ncbi:16S rRNA (guanine(966)-N(2))-methyltransferase RsmD [Falsihalocynthiibacter sp. BN13B15]|uniref:16S rRNA (guanine(966)-N(2))-methyltransferase RsmD n=1 Tax=Falsihalocynthiibacter sp. BN13B15 TaxID=3240871 RepID=UPI00350FBCC7
MRIIAGIHRGTKLTDVGSGDDAAHLRPTSDRVRESLFNVLNGGAFGRPIEGARVLDLFAGTGALGLEALSRGAEHVTFVDNGRIAKKLVRENIKILHREADSSVLTCAANGLPAAQKPCHLIFLDPPYGQDLGAPALENALKMGWIDPKALIVWEEDQPAAAPRGFSRRDTRRYGNTHVTFLEPIA